LPIIITGKRSGRPQAANLAIATTEKHAEPTANLVEFDPDLLELQWAEGGWRMRAGKTVLKNFGHNETAGRQMLFLLRQLRVNQYGTVGGGQSVLEYWLRDGRAPQGFALNLRLSPLDQATLRVEKCYGQWCLRDALQMLLSFERGEQDAQRALAILRKYRFTQVGIVGVANPPILLFLTSPGDALRAVPPGGVQPAPQNGLMPAPGTFAGQPQIGTDATLAPTMIPVLAGSNAK
jgi:hypothetical protein